MKIGPNDALLVVDVQNDFTPGGALAVSGGDEIVPLINEITPRFRHRVFTRDWHPPNHCSFDDEPRFMDGSWPVHCVQDTPGAAFHPKLAVPADALVVSKGADPMREAYSGFEGTRLRDELRVRGIARVFVCGLATDYCVKNTAEDALGSGFEVILIEDACRAVDNPAGTGGAAIEDMQMRGIAVCDAADLSTRAHP